MNGELGTFGRWTNVMLGVWLMVAPQLLDYADPNAATVDIVLGPALLLMALVSLAVPRFRYVCTALGVALMFAPSTIGYETDPAKVHHVVVGAIVMATSLLPSGRGVPTRTVDA